MRIRRWFREFIGEARARSAGRRAMTASTGRSDIARTARGAVGIAGIGFSNAYKLIENDDHRYARSLDAERRLPASLFVSERDGIRNGSVMPLSERCIEDFASTRRPKADQAPQL